MERLKLPKRVSPEWIFINSFVKQYLIDVFHSGFKNYGFSILNPTISDLVFHKNKVQLGREFVDFSINYLYKWLRYNSSLRSIPYINVLFSKYLKLIREIGYDKPIPGFIPLLVFEIREKVGNFLFVTYNSYIDFFRSLLLNLIYQLKFYSLDVESIIDELKIYRNIGGHKRYKMITILSNISKLTKSVILY